MKKILSVLLIAVMMISCAAFAGSILESDPEEVMSFNRKAPVTDWEGEWVLAAAYIGEDFAEENDIETTGLIAVPEKAVTMEVPVEEWKEAFDTPPSGKKFIKFDDFGE